IAGGAIGARTISRAADDACRAGLDARGDRDFERVAGGHEAAAFAAAARVSHVFSRAAAARARALDRDRKEALLKPHAPAPVACAALLGNAARRGAAS